MAATITQADIIRQVLREADIGVVFSNLRYANVSTTSITEADSYGIKPTTGAKIPVNSPLKFLSPADGGVATGSSTTTLTDSTKAWTVNEWAGFTAKMDGRAFIVSTNTSTALTFTATADAAPTVGEYTIELPDLAVTNYTTSTGAVSFTPTLPSLNAAQVRTFSVGILTSEFDHFDHLREAIKRTIENRTYRVQRTPLTYVADGDLRGSLVADYWTAAANGTAVYANAQVYPAGSAADVAGPVGLNRVLQLTSTGATSVTGNGIRAQHSTQQRPWYFWTAIRLVSGTGTATFSIRDNTNAADITLQVTRGNDSNTLTTTTFGDFMVCEGTFQQPATCDEVAPRLTLSATTMVGQMAPVIMFPLDAVSFPLPDRISSAKHVGNFRYATTLSGPGGLGSMAFSEPLTTGGYTHTLNDSGDHLTVSFNFRPTQAVWFDECVYDNALPFLTSTTTFPLDYIVKAVIAEMRVHQYEKAVNKPVGATPPEQSAYINIRLRAANSALRRARSTDYEPETIIVHGRV